MLSSNPNLGHPPLWVCRPPSAGQTHMEEHRGSTWQQHGAASGYIAHGDLASMRARTDLAQAAYAIIAKAASDKAWDMSLKQPRTKPGTCLPRVVLKPVCGAEACVWC